MSRNYTQLTIKLLFGRASACAYPSCDTSLIYEDRGQTTVVAEIAHIRSEAQGGPRHDPAYVGDLDGPGNLLLLCGVHHKPVDRHEATYSIDELESWKLAQIERAGAGTTIGDDDVARFIRLSSEERAAIDKLARLAYRLEQSSTVAAGALKLIGDEYARERNRVFAAMGSMYEVDDDGTKSPIASGRIRLPQAQTDEYQRRFNVEFRQQQDSVREFATQFGEEVAVLRMMDRHLADLVDEGLAAAAGIVAEFDQPVKLAEHIDALKSSLRSVYDAARERF